MNSIVVTTCCGETTVVGRGREQDSLSSIQLKSALCKLVGSGDEHREPCFYGILIGSSPKGANNV